VWRCESSAACLPFRFTFFIVNKKENQVL